MTACTARGDRWVCQAEAVWIADTGCIHEHIGHDPVCDPHRTQTERLGAIMVCNHCADHPELPHLCLVKITFRAVAPVPAPVQGRSTGR